MSISRAGSLGPGEREPLFHTLLTPKSSRPPSPSFFPASPKRARSALQVAQGVMIVAALAMLALTSMLTAAPAGETKEWVRGGCHLKGMALPQKMNETLQEARKSRDVPADLGNPVGRRPRTAILNAVRFHTEVVASLVYHFVKLNHDVTVYNRDDSLGMERVVHPFHAAGFKRYERFYSSFYEYDVIVIGTFPTCHVETVAQLIALGLPQRFLAVVHNPELLADDDVSATLAAAAGKLQLFTIAPHVNDYANDILEAEGLSNVAKAEWIVPIFPVIFPESCHDPRLAGPSGPASKQPACNRTAVWRGIEETRPAPVLELDEEEYRRKLRRSTLSAPEPEAEEGSGSSKGKDKKGSESKGGKQTGHASEADLDDYEGMGPAGLARRRGFCVQGKLDPSRRDYVSLFEDITSRKEALLASDFALVLLGKASGKGGKNVLHTPGHLEEEGLVMNYISLPFQEYYEVLHSCLAIMPAFASEAYFINKGSSSVAASLISGTPLVATPRLLAAYTFLDAASVYLIPEGVPDADAMQAIMALPPELLTAKVASVERLRRHVYDRNLALLQLALGDQYLFKRRIGKSDSASADAGGKGKHVKEVVAMWYDGGGPIWTAE